MWVWWKSEEDEHLLLHHSLFSPAHLKTGLLEEQNDAVQCCLPCDPNISSAWVKFQIVSVKHCLFVHFILLRTVEQLDADFSEKLKIQVDAVAIRY